MVQTQISYQYLNFKQKLQLNLQTYSYQQNTYKNIHQQLKITYKAKKMSELQIEVKTTQNNLQIKINYPSNPQQSYNFKLTVSIYEQNIVTKTQKLEYQKIFHVQQRQILIKDLKYSTMYKVVFVNKYGPNSKAIEKTKNLFVFTESKRNQQIENSQPEFLQSQISYQQRSYSRQPSRNTGSRRPSTASSKKPAKNSTYSNSNLCNSELLVKTLAQSNHIVHKDKAHKYLLESRKCRNINQFINQRNGKRINPSQVSDKMMLYIQSKLLFAEIYQYRDGFRYFKNDWAMGPFYSYDANEKQIKRQ